MIAYFYMATTSDVEGLQTTSATVRVAEQQE